MWHQIALALRSGDVYIYLILFLGFLGLVAFFERFFMLQFAYNLNFKKFVNNLKKMVQAEDLERAINLCKKAGSSSLPMIALKALEAAETDPTTIKGTIEEETLDFLPNLEKRLNFLPMIATLILLAGILGTINSLWIAFHSLNVFDTAQKQVVVGQSIASSLSYTALGLVLCMLFLIGHHIIKSMSLRLIQRLQYGTTVLYNLLVPQDITYVPVGAVSTAAKTEDTSVVMPPMQEAKQAESKQVENSETQTSTTATMASEVSNESHVEDIKDEEEII